MAASMIALYGIGIGVVWIFGKRQPKDDNG
jgi:Sec-independent protein secretion pathway component TatC